MTKVWGKAGIILMAATLGACAMAPAELPDGQAIRVADEIGANS